MGLLRAGYTFQTWNTGNTGGGTSYAEGSSYNTASNVTLYAIWDYTFTGTITYGANGGSGSISNQSYNSAQSTVTLSNGSGLSRAGYTLTGWDYIGPGGLTYSLSDTVSIGSNPFDGGTVSLAAQWTQDATTTPEPATTGLFIDGYEEFYEQNSSENYTANLTNVSNPTYQWSTNGSYFNIQGTGQSSSVWVDYNGNADCMAPDSGSVSVTVNGQDSNGNPVTLSDSLIITGCDIEGQYSDVELKENIELVGKSQMGYNIYNWNWKDPEKYGHGTYQGVIAQEMPIEIVGQKRGYLTVNYKSIDVEFKKIKD